ncbi:hypothetical protein D3C73_892930 [compost metagenome]
MKDKLTMKLHDVSKFLLLTACIFLHSVALAGVCQPPTVHKDSPYHYLVSLTSALSYAKSSLDRASSIKPDSKTADFDLLFALKLGKGDFECAKLQVSPYSSSSNEAVNTSAQGAELVFSRLVDLQDESISDIKTFLDTIAEGKRQTGTILEKQAELATSYDEAWKRLIYAVIAATYAVVVEDPATGLMSRLALTQVERDTILNNLYSTFGDEVKFGMKAGQKPLMSAAAILYEVLGNPGYKLLNSR